MAGVNHPRAGNGPDGLSMPGLGPDGLLMPGLGLPGQPDAELNGSGGLPSDLSGAALPLSASCVSPASYAPARPLGARPLGALPRASGFAGRPWRPADHGQVAAATLAPPLLSSVSTAPTRCSQSLPLLSVHYPGPALGAFAAYPPPPPGVFPRSHVLLYRCIVARRPFAPPGAGGLRRLTRLEIVAGGILLPLSGASSAATTSLGPAIPLPYLPVPPIGQGGASSCAPPSCLVGGPGGTAASAAHQQQQQQLQPALDSQLPQIAHCSWPQPSPDSLPPPQSPDRANTWTPLASPLSYHPSQAPLPQASPTACTPPPAASRNHSTLMALRPQPHYPPQDPLPDVALGVGTAAIYRKPGGACRRLGNPRIACDQCGHTFSRNHDMKRHRAVHLAVAPFFCRNCSERFRRKDALRVGSRAGHRPCRMSTLTDIPTAPRNRRPLRERLGPAKSRYSAARWAAADGGQRPRDQRATRQQPSNSQGACAYRVKPTPAM